VAPNDVAIEGLRSLRTALQFGALKQRNKVVMFTGPRPGIGKSFVSVNFAAVLAAGGERVLLIDGDMRRGNIRSLLGLTRRPGLSELLRDAELDAVVHHDVLPKLDVIIAGDVSAQPSELLMSQRLSDALGQLRERYDYVIIDSPPVLAVTDAGLIGRHVDATLLVVRHGYHTAAELGETMRQLASAGVPADGALLTDTPSSGTSYGAFSQYASRSE
jgi:tyrosine-protein kinase Etk/Wzc